MHSIEYNEIFSENLNYLLSKRGKRQTDLCNDLKIHKATISSWCRGTRMPKLDKISLIAEYLNLDNPLLLLDKNLKNII